MKVKILGTAAGIPAPNRECSSVMIESHGSIYLVDCGATVTHKICDSGLSADNIKAVFITHAHLDHMYGFSDILRVVNKRKAGSPATEYYFPEQLAIDAWKKYFTEAVSGLSENLHCFRLYGEGIIFKDENITVTAKSNAHLKKYNRPSYTFLVEAEGKRLLFSGDLSQELAEGDFPAIAKEKEIDLFVLEYAHFDVEDMLPHLEECKLERLVFSHISRASEKLPLIEALAESGRFDFSVDAATDGFEINL